MVLLSSAVKAIVTGSFCFDVHFSLMVIRLCPEVCRNAEPFTPIPVPVAQSSPSRIRSDAVHTPRSVAMQKDSVKTGKVFPLHTGAFKNVVYSRVNKRNTCRENIAFGSKRLKAQDGQPRVTSAKPSFIIDAGPSPGVTYVGPPIPVLDSLRVKDWIYVSLYIYGGYI